MTTPTNDTTCRVADLRPGDRITGFEGAATDPGFYLDVLSAPTPADPATGRVRFSGRDELGHTNEHAIQGEWIAQVIAAPATDTDTDCTHTGFSGEGRCIEPAGPDGLCTGHRSGITTGLQITLDLDRVLRFAGTEETLVDFARRVRGDLASGLDIVWTANGSNVGRRA